MEDAHTASDYDGDTLADLAVWRPADGSWHIRNSANGEVGALQLGQPGDVPMTGDYDGDGISDLAIWRPSSGVWSIHQSSAAGAVREAQWGAPGDLPVAGDYNGDRVATWRSGGPRMAPGISPCRRRLESRWRRCSEGSAIGQRQATTTAMA